MRPTGVNVISIFGFVLFSLCGIQPGYAQDIEKKLQLSLSTGSQREDFHWSIAGNTNGQNPNVLSELRWKNVSGQDYAAALQWNVWRRFSLYADYTRVFVRSGTVSDIDYNGDNRTDAINTGNFSDNKGNTSAWSGGLGYIIFNNKLFGLVPYIGYGVSNQYLSIVDLTGQFPTLNSSYRATWNGPFLKVKSSIKIIRALKLAAEITYNQVNYSARGDWNLIQEFQQPVSYRHVAKGYGLSANAKLIYNITSNIGTHIGYSYFNWETGNGNDQLFLTSGQVDKTQLNGVFRNGFGIVGGLNLSL